MKDGLKWYAIDFDDVLATSIWPDRGIGKPIHKNIKKLDEVMEHGYKIHIHTSRPWSDYEIIEDWLIEHNIPFDGIECGKFLAHRYVDDKAVNSEQSSWI